MNKIEVSQIPWRKPWHALELEYAVQTEAELHREVCAEHVLFGRSVTAIGYRQDCDDVLFYLGESAPSLAVVHLTYQREIRPEWPCTTLFDTVAAWIEQCLIRDAEEFDN